LIKNGQRNPALYANLSHFGRQAIETPWGRVRILLPFSVANGAARALDYNLAKTPTRLPPIMASGIKSLSP